MTEPELVVEVDRLRGLIDDLPCMCSGVLLLPDEDYFSFGSRCLRCDEAHRRLLEAVRA